MVLREHGNIKSKPVNSSSAIAKYEGGFEWGVDV